MNRMNSFRPKVDKIQQIGEFAKSPKVSIGGFYSNLKSKVEPQQYEEMPQEVQKNPIEKKREPRLPDYPKVEREAPVY